MTRNDDNEKNEHRTNLDDHRVDTAGLYLRDKSIALCVTGGIAAIETPKIARQLRRYGAEVKGYLTDAAQQFIGKSALEWGTGQGVVTELSGLAEHLCQEDAVLIAPATTNTINKIFAGIADNPVTTLVASALGQGKPVYLAPCMHESLYNNPFLQDNLARAGKHGMKIIPPRFGEGKAKIARLETIVAGLAHDLSEDPLQGKRILVTAGPTPVRIDAVRIITNKFRGTLGKLIAQEAYLLGAEVKLLLGDTGMPVPEYLDVRYHSDFAQYRENTLSALTEQKYDGGIFSAAVADFQPKEVYPGKFPSENELHLDFTHTPKVIKEVRERFPELYMVTFKYEEGISKEGLLEIARGRVQSGFQMVVANRGEDYVEAKHRAYIVGTEGILAQPEGKKEIARELLDVLGKKLGK